MASFKSILSTILGIEKIAEPALMLIPGAAPVLTILDPIFTKLQADINTVEVTKTADTPSQSSSDAVIANFENGLQVAQAFAATEGKMVVYDKLALQTAINAQVSALNSMATVKASFKMVPLPAAAGGTA